MPVVVGGLLLAYATLLVFLAHREASVTPFSQWALHHYQLGPAEINRAKELAQALLLTALGFAPLGFFTALLLPLRSGFLARHCRTTVPALLTSFFAAFAVRGFQKGSPWELPGLLDMLFPALGCVAGVVLGITLQRGWRGLAALLVTASLVLALLIGVGLGGAYFALSKTPLPIEPVQVTSASKRQIVARLRRSNPLTLKEGEVARLELPASDLRLLLAWGLPLISSQTRADVETREGSLRVRNSLFLPIGFADRRYLNLVVAASGDVTGGDLALDLDEIAIGQMQAPAWLRQLLAGLVRATLVHERAFEPVLSSLDELTIQPQGVTARYRKMELKTNARIALRQLLGPAPGVLKAAHAQLKHFTDAAPYLSKAQDRFGASLETAFTLARQRSAAGQPVEENQGAILALATLLGHPRLAVFAGLDSNTIQVERTRRRVGIVRLRKRGDWTQHFFVSAGLTQISSTVVSDAAGLLKEELDADGGSGFSFADLLADRAGTLFAWSATRDEPRARAMQDRLAAGFQLEEFFPVPSGLPEGISDGALEQHFGGVGGEGYLRMIRDIEQRLSTCAAYR